MDCKTCKYFSPEYDELGSCHRYPEPILKREKDWCGEHTPKAVRKAKTNEKV